MVIQFWQVQRANMAYHRCESDSCVRFRARCRYVEYRCEVFRYVCFRYRDVRCQFCDLGMGVLHLRSNQRKESIVFGDRQHHRQCFIHMDSGRSDHLVGWNLLLTWRQYLWPSSDEPRYAIAMCSSAGFSIACASGAWCMKIILMRLNKKIRQSNDETTLFYAY